MCQSLEGVSEPSRREYVCSFLLCLAVSGCAAHARPTTVPDQFVTLNSHSLRLHFDNRDAPAERPLLVYATGDGGMHRKDLDTYRHLAALGDPIVGFDAHDYVKHLGNGSLTTTPERLAEDYRTIIARARQALGLSDHRPVVLVGVSRGAGLAVVAAARLRDMISGVVAVALTQEEEYVRWYRHLPLPHEAHRAVMVDVYEYLADLGDVPIAVVQSTHDRYLPAVDARAQFGPDTPSRWFQSIDAANHNFGGARSRMYEAIRTAVTWVTTLRREPASQGSGPPGQRLSKHPQRRDVVLPVAAKVRGIAAERARTPAEIAILKDANLGAEHPD